MLTKIKGTGTGVNPVVDLTFPFIDKSHVLATVNGGLVDLNWKTASQVQFAAPVPTGAPWVVYRDTPTQPLVDFTNNAVLTESDLNLAHLQHQYRDEELADDVTDAASGINYTDENARDAIGAALVAGANVQINVNDAADTITISATDTNTTDPEVVRDTMGAALVAGANVTIAVDDAADTITISAAGNDAEFVRDTIGATLVAGANVTIAVDDPGNTITISAAGAGGGSTLAVGNYGDVTSSNAGATITINPGVVTLAKMANLAANSILGNNTGAAATPIALTGAQVAAMLPAFGSATSGTVPASGGGTTNFLRADGSWAAPSISVTQFNSTTAGTVPASGGGTANFIRADGVWAAPPGNGQTAQSVVFTNGTSADGAGASFNGSVAKTVNYNTVGAAPATSPVQSFSADATIVDANNNAYWRFIGSTAHTVTLGNISAGTSLTIANRSSVALALSIPGGLYKNGASTTATTGSLAVNGKIVLFHEGGGVWTADGSGLS